MSEVRVNVDGELDDVDGRSVLRFRRELAHPREKVWRALTEPAHLAVWFPTSIDGARVAGAPLRFVFPEGEADAFDGEMIACDPPALLEFRWGTDTLRFELHVAGANTVLVLTDTLDARGKAARDGAGWHGCLDVLEYVLADQTPPWNIGERWGHVHDQYVERFGPDAATIGPPTR